MQVIKDITLKDTLFYRNIPVFIYQIIYPSFTTTCSASSAQKINNYYTQKAKAAEAYCRTVLYPLAAERARYIPESDQAFNSSTFDVTYKITYNHKCTTSLYMDAYTYMGGAHGETKRTSDTWDFTTGTKLSLKDVYALTPTSLQMLQSSIEQQISDRLKENPGSYFEDYKTLLQKTLDISSYYIQPGLIVIYFQQYDIAPYATGLPEFYFPLQSQIPV